MRKICWIIPGRDWSFDILAGELIRNLPDFEHYPVYPKDGIDKLSENIPPDIDLYYLFHLNYCNLFSVEIQRKMICSLSSYRQFEEKNLYPANNSGHYIIEETAFDDNIRQFIGVIALNKWLYDICKRSNSNTWLVPNGTDIKTFRPGNVPEKFTVGFSGNISYQPDRDYKGVRFAREACQILGVPIQEQLFGKAQITHEQMVHYFYDRISCLVLPSLGEGCSLTILEALSCGIPVLITKECGYHAEMLRDGVNCLLIERNSQSIVRAIKMLQSSPDLYRKLQINGRLFALRYHDAAAFADKHRQIFNSCLNCQQNVEDKNIPEQIPVIMPRRPMVIKKKEVIVEKKHGYVPLHGR